MNWADRCWAPILTTNFSLSQGGLRISPEPLIEAVHLEFERLQQESHSRLPYVTEVSWQILLQTDAYQPNFAVVSEVRGFLASSRGWFTWSAWSKASWKATSLTSRTGDGFDNFATTLTWVARQSKSAWEWPQWDIRLISSVHPELGKPRSLTSAIYLHGRWVRFQISRGSKSLKSPKRSHSPSCDRLSWARRIIKLALNLNRETFELPVDRNCFCCTFRVEVKLQKRQKTCETLHLTLKNLGKTINPVKVSPF